jgi:pyruvate kinase
MKQKHSRSQIVATLGPSSRSREVIKSMLEHQMDVVRLNFSHGTYEDHGEYINATREISRSLDRHIPIIQDLSGPRVDGATGHHFGGESDKSIVTEKDLKDLAFGVESAVDYVAMSYIGSAVDVLEIKEKIKKLGASIPVISKIERQSAVQNIDSIIRESNAIMIARGDLGQAIPIERIPFVEHMIIQKCKSAGKPVIVATEMLFSMVSNPRPTRAEVTDVAYAILSGADAVMLSDETARGKYPLQSIKVMERIVLEAESHIDHEINPL